VPKELNGRLEENALGRLSFQTVLSKSGKDCIETFDQLFGTISKDNYVI